MPNGLIANLFGPVEGKQHDCALLRESDILTKMEAQMHNEQGEAIAVYGDPALCAEGPSLLSISGCIFKCIQQCYV